MASLQKKSSRTPSEAPPAVTSGRDSATRPPPSSQLLSDTRASAAKKMTGSANMPTFMDKCLTDWIGRPGPSSNPGGLLPTPAKKEEPALPANQAENPIEAQRDTAHNQDTTADDTVTTPCAIPTSGLLAQAEVRNICTYENQALRAQLTQEIRAIRSDVACCAVRHDDQERRMVDLRVAMDRSLARLDDADPSVRAEPLVQSVQALREDVNRLLESQLAPVQPVTDVPDPLSMPPDLAQYAVTDRNLMLDSRRSSGKKHRARKGKGDRRDKKKHKPRRKHDSSGSSSSESSSSNSSDSDCSEDSDSSDDEARKKDFEVPSRIKGPKFHGLKELKPTNPAYDKLVSYRYYRLERTSHKRTSKKSDQVKAHLKRLELSLKDYRFTGTDPILAFEFFSRFVTEANILHMNEGQAYMALPSFLKSFANEQFMAIKDASTEAEGGVTCWPEAVQYLLRSYAAPNAIRGATLALRNMRQNPNETERDFSTRLDKACFRCGNVYPLDEKITLYIDGLNPAIRPIVSRFREDEPRKKVTYQGVVQFAQAEGDALRASRRVTLPKTPFLLANPMTKLTHKDHGKTRVLFADSPAESYEQQSYRTEATQDMDNVYLLQDGTTSIATTDLPSTAYKSLTTDPVLAMGRGDRPKSFIRTLAIWHKRALVGRSHLAEGHQALPRGRTQSYAITVSFPGISVRNAYYPLRTSSTSSRITKPSRTKNASACPPSRTFMRRCALLVLLPKMDLVCLRLQPSPRKGHARK